LLVATGNVAMALVYAGCSPTGGAAAESSPEASRQRVINGADDRRELYELESVEAQTAIGASVAALMWSHRIDYRNPSVIRAVSLQEARGVCPNEAFAAQPAAAFCSATLIDEDLVLTAGHCLGSGIEAARRRCGQLLVVFDYHYAGPNELALDSSEDIYACRAVALYQHGFGATTFQDMAILQLDRRVSGDRKPAILASVLPTVGDALVAASHGAGLPLKVDRGGEVVEVAQAWDHFVASTDSLAGGSGSPLFNMDLQLVGHQVRGASDWESSGECARAIHSYTPGEQHQLVARSLQALCGAGWPSQRLCDRAPNCGDGICNGAENGGDCPIDCARPTCGDGSCELDERSSCPRDCARYADVPPSWLDEPVLFEAIVEPRAEADDTPLSAAGGCRVGAYGPGRDRLAPWASLLLGIAAFWRRATASERARNDARV
jgi:hypothetical protein